MAPRGGQACRWATAAAARRVLEGLSQPYDAWTQEGALPLPLPGLPYSEREAEVGSPSKTVLMTPSKSVILLNQAGEAELYLERALAAARLQNAGLLELRA